MATYKGYIREIIKRPTDYGMMYNIKLSTGDQIGFGKFPPKMNENDYVQVEAELNEKGYLNGNKKTFKVLEAPKEEVQVGASVNVVSKNTSLGKDDYWKGKEARDLANDRARNVGAARNTAIAWIDVLLKNAVFKLPSKKDEAEDAVNTLLDELTKKFMVGVTEKKEDGETSSGAAAPAGVAGGSNDDGDWNA